MTSLPAHVFGLDDRGDIRPGAFADLVVFDLKNVVDRATYADPFQLADGMDWVIVNGVVARQNGEFTGARSGRVLKPLP
jgi:N-acyl-D-aspartate/D-glutamate deacylase